MPPANPLRLLFVLACFAPLPAWACSGALHIELESDGVYALDQAAIVAAQPGLADCGADRLRLSQAGEPVPLRVAGTADGRFAPGARVEWVGRQLHGPLSWFNTYSVRNVYVLSAGEAGGARLRDAAPVGGGRAPLQRRLHLEQENLMIRLDQQQQKPGEESDVWQWAKLTHVDPLPFGTGFDLPDLATRATPVELTLNFRGLSRIFSYVTEPKDRVSDHAVNVTVNDVAVGTVNWDGRDEVARTLKLPASLLKAHGNTLSLSVPKRPMPPVQGVPPGDIVDVVMFNWMELRYPIAGSLDTDAEPFEIEATTPQPLQLTWRGDGEPVLYGDDGVRRPGRAIGDGRFEFAAAGPGVVLHPVFGERYAKPLAQRAVADATDWRARAGDYDYLVVSHPSLTEAVMPLVEFHRKRGLKVGVLDIGEVYDQFNHGIIHPRAIRNLVDHAWHAHSPARLRYVLLVGGASFDIRHDKYNDAAYAKFAGQSFDLTMPGQFATIPGTAYEKQPEHLGSRNLIPTWQYPSPEGQSASDNWYGSVDGDDFHPVVAIGRFPVVEPAEVAAIVEKTIDYAARPQLGAWRRDVMFITDESEYFRKASDDIAKRLGEEGFSADRVYASPDEADNLAHQSAIKDGLNEGRLLVHFLGHGGRYIWRTGPPDLRKNHDLFTLDDVSGLSNTGRLPMVLSMTCYSAPFDHPSEDSIGQRFLREPKRGAVAVFAASWRNSPSTHYSDALVRELLVPGQPIGDAIVKAKRGIGDRTLVETYNLLGDPALVLERPTDHARIVRDEERWADGVLVALPGTMFRGRVDVDWIDDKGSRVASASYDAERTSLRLPRKPPSMPSAQVRRINVYAANALTSRDAVAMFDFAAAPASPADASKSAGPARPYRPRQRVADTITLSDFDDAGSAVASTSKAQVTTEAPSGADSATAKKAVEAKSADSSDAPRKFVGSAAKKAADDSP